MIVEILSKRTQAADRGKKKAIYEKVFRTPEYFLFDPEKLALVGYRLSRGRYVTIPKDGKGRLWSERLKLGLGVHEDKLRFFDARGALVPRPEEEALRALERVREVREEVARLRRRLRALGEKA